LLRVSSRFRPLPADEWERLVNRGGYTWRGLADSEQAGLDDAKVVALVLRHPTLIRRPLIQSPVGISVGFSEKVRSRLG
jgi:arsenate reductase (glutaredoxin)